MFVNHFAIDRNAFHGDAWIIDCRVEFYQAKGTSLVVSPDQTICLYDFVDMSIRQP